MRLLLDTHAFLWFIEGSANLTGNARQLIEDPANDRYLSVASCWEIAIKLSKGKLEIGGTIEDMLPNQLRQNRIELLDIALAHVIRVASLPFHHRDPFDRLLAAQCLTEDLPIVSADPVFDDYGVRRLW